MEQYEIAEIEQHTLEAVNQERRRVVGMILAEYAVRKMAGQLEAAAILDALATDIEHKR